MKLRIFQKERGVTMIEVMVTMLIIAVGLLGLLGLQARSLSGHRDSIDRKAAAELIAGLSERMRANHLGFMSDSYTSQLALTDALVANRQNCTTSTACGPVATADSDIQLWQRTLRSRLPDSAAFVSTIPAGAAMNNNGVAVRVSVVWREVSEGAMADPQCAALGITDPLLKCLSAEVFP